MQTKKTIAILGASGNMGSAIAMALAKGRDRLLLISKEEEKIAVLITSISEQHPAADVEAMGCVMHGSWEADIIILATPYEAQLEIAEKIREVANQKIVICITNSFTAAKDVLVTKTNTSAAEELQDLLPHTKVVTAFNTTTAANFINAVIDGKQVDAFIAGNNEAAIQTTAELVKTIGFNPVIAGNLYVSRTLEAMQLLLAQLSERNNYNSSIGWKILQS